MRYFKHHIGDYAAHTQHLSFVEDAAYHRLMRVYYQTEKPLLSDSKAIARLVGARTKEEREAVEAMLKEFFTLESDGWHQVRCDREIALQQEKSSKASKSGKLGGRPRADTKPLENNETAKANASTLESERTPTEKLPTTHYPLTIKEEEERKSIAASPLVPRSPDEPAVLNLEIPIFLDREIKSAIAEFNAMAERVGLAKAQKIEPDRRRALKARLKDCGGLEGWTIAVGKIEASDFLCGRTSPGKGHENWRPDLDFFLKPKQFRKLMEGGHDNPAGQQRRPEERSLTATLAGLAEAGAR